MVKVSVKYSFSNFIEFIYIYFSFIVINVEKRKESKQDRKEELTISQIIENKANSYTLIQVRISCNPL